MSAIIVRKSKSFRLEIFCSRFFVSILFEIFSCRISENPRVKEDRAVEEVVVGFCSSEVVTRLKVNPRSEEAFNAWNFFC